MRVTRMTRDKFKRQTVRLNSSFPFTFYEYLLTFFLTAVLLRLQEMTIEVPDDLVSGTSSPCTPERFPIF